MGAGLAGTLCGTGRGAAGCPVPQPVTSRLSDAAATLSSGKTLHDPGVTP